MKGTVNSEISLSYGRLFMKQINNYVTKQFYYRLINDGKNRENTNILEVLKCVFSKLLSNWMAIFFNNFPTDFFYDQL